MQSGKDEIINLQNLEDNLLLRKMFNWLANHFYNGLKFRGKTFYWLITQKVFLGSGTEKILYKPPERALKMLSFDSNFICIGSRGA